MKKKVLALASAMIIAFTLSVGALPEGLTNVLGANTISASALTTSGDYEYAVFADDTVEITHYTGTATTLTIPSTIDGKRVLVIGGDSFAECKSLVSVTIPNSVSVIAQLAFRDCTSLTSVTIPSNVTDIISDAFGGCTSLASITVDASNADYISVDGVLFNKAVTELISYPLGKATESYTIPSTVTSVGDFAFDGSTILKSVTIPLGVTSIGDYAFRSSKSLTSVTIPNSMKSIGESAFSNCTRLTNVTIPDGLTSIGGNAFADCTSLTSVTISSSVTNIGSYAFSHCNSLTSIAVDASNTNYASIDGVLFNKNKTTLLCYPAGKAAKTYTIPSSVTSIGDHVFFGCTSLNNVIIPSSVISIGRFSFSGCDSLTSVIIPSSVTSIGDCAFYFCTSLTSVTIPSSVTSIGSEAFAGCTKLTSISVSADNPNYSASNGILFNKEKNVLICYPAGKTENTFTIPSTVIAIGESAFVECKNLTNVIFPSNVKIIGGNSFFNCTGLTSVIIPPSVLSIGTYAFGFYENAQNFFDINNNFVVIGYSGSAAQKFAANNQFAFFIISSTPSSMRTVSATYNSIKIAWASVSGASGYEIWRSDTSSGKNTLVGDVKTNYFTNVNLTRTTAYYYKVRAYCIVGNTKVYSGFTTYAAKTNFAAPAPITSLGRTKTSIKFGWNPVYGASGYEVYRSNTSSGTYALMGTVTTNSFNNTRLTRKANYYYKVRAYRFVGKTKVYSDYGTFYAAVKA